MSRQSDWIRTDFIKRLSCKDFDLIKNIFSGIRSSSYTQLSTRCIVSGWLRKKSFHFSKTEQRNRCKVTGRSYFVLSRAGLSRLSFKFFSGLGLLTGVSRRGK